MDAPKCKICNERHYGLCPGNKRSRANDRPPKPKAPTSTPVLGSKPKAERRRSATAKTLVQASAESTDAGGMQDRSASIPPPINPRADAKPSTPSPIIDGGTVGLIPATGAKPRRGRPRLEDRDKTLTARKPWAALGMSESTWRRRRAEAATDEGLRRVLRVSQKKVTLPNLKWSEEVKQ